MAFTVWMSNLGPTYVCNLVKSEIGLAHLSIPIARHFDINVVEGSLLRLYMCWNVIFTWDTSWLW